jgi:hypothetical protein
VVVGRVEGVGRTRGATFFAGTAAEVGDASVVDVEVATPLAVVEREPPHATVNTNNVPTTACVPTRRQGRAFTAAA